MLKFRPSAKRIKNWVNLLRRDSRGAVAVEYGLLAAMIGIALIGMLTVNGVTEQNNENFSTLSSAMRN
jgi:Flp pilus assembly pilin Flp